MNWVRGMVLAVVSVSLAAPVSAQVPTRGSRVTHVSTAPRLMVANPFVFAAADSAPAVQIGTAVREEVSSMVGDDYNVVEREQMNEALSQYGYPVDAILSPSLAVTLAKNIQARSVVTATMVKGEDGRYAITARLAGVNDEAGNVVAVTQQRGERLIEFGQRIAEALEPSVKALGDAKACVEMLETDPDKAARSAQKAVKRVPNHGLAQICLYQVAERRKAPRQEAIKHLEAAVKGDSLSVSAWSRLARQYYEARDTANTLQAFKQLLRVAPTDQALRQRIFRYFLQAGQPKLALEVAEEGLKIDPYNPELYDLKSDACLFLEDYRCAIDALETRYATDSTKADTLFFVKIAAAAAVEGTPDTARLLEWSQRGASKYPDNLTLLGYLNQAYVWTGQVDSSIAVTRQIIQRDTTAVRPALAAVQALGQADRMTEAGPFVDFIKRYGSPEEKEQLAGIFVPVALKRLQGDSTTNTPRDLPAAVELARQAIDVADTNGRAVGWANYILGLGLFFQAAEIDAETERQKSCDMARQEQQLLTEAKQALSKAQSTNQSATQQYLGYIEKFMPRVSAMLKAYCK